MKLHLDFETRSDLDLMKVGLSIYAKGRYTDIMCAAYAFDDEPVQLWLPHEPFPKDVFKYIESGGLIHAHNAAFERDIANAVGVRKYGWPYLYTEQMVCTMAMAYAMALPGSLEGCAAALGIPEQKDMEGSRIMKVLTKPKVFLPDGKPLFWDEPEKLKRLYEYCKQDVVVEREIGKRLLPLSNYEKKLWNLDQKINSRGIRVDVSAAFQASLLVEEEKKFLNKAIQEVSNGEIASCNAVAQIKKFLVSKGIQDVESIDKAAVVEFLKQDIPKECKEVLRLRSLAGKASTAKLDTMISGADTDHRIKGCFQFSGAATRRWAGRRVQLHNLPRPKRHHSKIEKIITSLKAGVTSEEFKDFIGEPLEVISDLIRGMLVAADNHEFIAADFSAIEARVIAWLSGETKILDVFRNGHDPYIAAASDIFGVPMSAVTKNQRAVGKVAVLALGFGGGVGAFQQMAKGYGVTMAPAYSYLWSRANEDTQDRVEKSFSEYETKSRREGIIPISREEFVASDLTKIFWRQANPSIVQFWHDLEEAVIQAVDNPGKIYTVGAVAYKTSGSFLFCRLPSGGCLSYPYPEIRLTKTPWGAKKRSLTYMSEESQSKRWIRFTTYGGSLAENVTQAVARDLLADAMLRVEEKGFPIVLHVHDEIVCELPIGKAKLEDLTNLMAVLPSWAKGLPLSSSGYKGTRYRKD